jgi:hypothetical protein
VPATPVGVPAPPVAAPAPVAVLAETAADDDREEAA